MSSTANVTEKYQLLSDSEDVGSIDIPTHQARPWQALIRCLLKWGVRLICVSSITLNLLQFTPPVHDVQKGTEWADLTYDVPTPIYSSTEYGPAIGTEAERDSRWESIDISEGVIALPDDLAKQWGLPLSERFPWDQSKGVYLLGAHHQVHCLKRTYDYISSTHVGRTPKLSYEHIVHCLDTLLQDAWCHADDTPWMQLPPQPYRQKYAEFQTRQCKSWDKLMTWARKYNACYQNENIFDMDGLPSTDAFEHFKYCPEGSPYINAVEKFFAQRAKGMNATEAYELYGNS